MHLSRIKLDNFRSIKKADVSIFDVTALVGENNSGKSSLLRALNVFFNYEEEQTNLITGTHQYSPTSMPRVELVFEDIPDGEPAFDGLCTNGLLTVRVTYSPNTKKRQVHIKKDGKYKNIGESIISNIKNHINFVLIPPNRTPEKLKWEKATLLSEIVDAFLDQVTSSRDNFSSKFKLAATNLERNALRKISNQAKELYSLNHEFSFEIGFEKGLTYRDFLNGIQILVKEKSNTYDLLDCGTGVQSLTIIALHRLLSKLRNNSVILGIEEPETNLHPQAQRELINSIKEYAGTEDIAQIVCTTHSSVVIDQLRHDQVIHLRKVPDSSRGFRTETNFIPSNFFEKYNLQEENYYNFHQYKNSDFFFAKYIIFVESRSDGEIVKLLAKKLDYDLDLYGVSVVSIDGVNNLKYPLHLVKELGIPYLVIVDKDYFFPYLEGSLDKSRDPDGFPKYRYKYKNQCLIEELVSNKKQREKLLNLFKTNYSRALNILVENNVISMRYSLEIDLIATKIGADLFYELLDLPSSNRIKKSLLVGERKQIKKILNILHVVDRLPDKNLPNSYKRIKKVLREIVRSS